MKLSIIVPVYNVEQYLRKCIDSLLAQDYSDYEIILIDDGSRDNCPQICDDYAAEYDNIRVVHRENGGLSAARNTGIAAAKGGYISFVDSDDYWQPKVLGGLIAQIERDNLDVLRFKYQNVRIKEEGVYEVFQPYKRDARLENDYTEVPIDGVSFLNQRMNTQCYACSYIIRRDILNDCMFTPGIYFEDIDWTPRMLVRAKRVASTDTIVYNYLLTRQGSITNAVSRSKQKKVLDDKMRLLGEMQRQTKELKQKGLSNAWFSRMIADTVISIMGIISTDFYVERRGYMEQLKKLDIYPIKSKSIKAFLINLSPCLAIKLLHLKKSKQMA